MYETEKKLIRRWGWIAVPAGAFAAMMAGSWLWPMVEQVRPLPPLDPLSALRFPFVAIAAGVALFPVLWRATIFLRERGVLPRFPYAAVGAVAAVLMVEGMFRLPVVQQPFWLAVRTRNPGESEFFARELALLRLDSMADRAKPHAPGLVFAGTSQLMLGIDYDDLRHRLPGTDVRRRSLAGMAPLRMAMAWPWLGVGPGDTVVMYLSAFDMTGVAGIGADWLRPTGNRQGFCDWQSVLPPGETIRHWRSMTDVAMASLFELWAARDHTRALVLGKPKPRSGPVRDHVIAQQVEQFQKADETNPYYEANFRALDRVLTRFAEAGARVVIIEGRVNPSLQTDLLRDLDRRTSRRLAELAGRRGARFVPVAEQAVAIGPGDWKDGTHLNASGRAKFTAYVADLFRVGT